MIGYSNKTRSNGFSLVELLMALMVTGIILTAVVTLAFALNTAYDDTSDISEKQAKIRFVSLNISELIGHCKLICADHTYINGDLIVWRNDDNGDNRINLSEIVYIETGNKGNYLRLLQFSPDDPWGDIIIWLYWIRQYNYKNALIYWFTEYRTTLLDQCEGIKITLDRIPPYTTLVNIKLDIEQNSQVRTYQISAGLRCQAVNLIKDPYTLVTDDD